MLFICCFIFYFIHRKDKKLQHINNLILDSLNYPCLIIDKNRIVIDANNVAKEVGTVIGEKCWNTFGQNLCLSYKNLQKVKDGITKDIKCTFCQADDCMNNKEIMNDGEVHAFGEIWDTYWIPINEHYILHYAINITDKIKYEDKLKKTAFDLKERNKELNCISEIAKIVQENDNFLPDIFSKIVNEIPKAFLKPEETCCCINYNNTLFKSNCNYLNPEDCIYTKNHKIIKKLKENIKLKIQLKNSHDFIPEEYTLIDIIEGRLNKSIERITINKALKESELKLIRSKKMEALGIMAGGVAHDLNNVLSGIVTTPELMLMKLDKNDPMIKYINIIMRSGEKAVAIVSELLTIARGVISKKVTLNINNIINEYLQSEEYKKILKFHPNVKVNKNLLDNLLLINASKIHIYKLILNLIGNAIESINDEGEIDIITDNVYLDTPVLGYDKISIGEYVYLKIKDSGIGISKYDIQHIFEPFYTKKEMGRSGTGLGLAVVWNVIQDHNGYINVKSSEKGTIFEVYFPVARQPIKDISSEKDMNNYKGNEETILIIDDSKEQLEISSDMLHHFNYKTKCVESGEKGIEYLKNNHVDLIILDMIMPKGMNGYETYLELKKIKPNIKVIIVSGYVKNILIDKALKAGVINYLKKPYRINEICKMIHSIFKKENI